MKSPVRPDAQPQRAVVAEHDLALGRLTEQAHVRHAAMGDQVSRAGGVAAVLGAHRVAVLRLLDLAGHGRDHHVAAEANTSGLQRAHRLHVTGERALHVRDAEPVQASVADEGARLEAGDVSEPRLPTGVRRVHVSVEHEAGATTDPLPHADRVRAPVLHLLPLCAQPELLVELGHQLGHRLLRPGEARRVDHPARRLHEPIPVDAHVCHAPRPPVR